MSKHCAGGCCQSHLHMARPGAAEIWVWIDSYSISYPETQKEGIP